MNLNTQIQMLKPATSNEKKREVSAGSPPTQNFPEPLSTQDALPLDGEFTFIFISTLKRWNVCVAIAWVSVERESEVWPEQHKVAFRNPG